MVINRCHILVMREFMMMEEALVFTTTGDLEGALSNAVDLLTAPLSSSWWEKHIIIIIIY